MSRALLVVLDSVGIGGAPDAAAFGDEGANTLGHIQAATGVTLPNLAGLGLWHALELASGVEVPRPANVSARWGAATELSRGKDTPSGHWELAGVPVPWDWHYFPHTIPTFPKGLTDRIIAAAGLPGILGDCHASGTEIIARLGEAHIATGKPICYTSADSVFQIAAHEESFGLDRLLDLCEKVAGMVHPMRVGRVIARPFLGEPGQFTRTANRRDFAIPPPEPTLCDRVVAAGGQTWAIGKLKDIFAGQGISYSLKGPDDMALIDRTQEALGTAGPGDLVFANFVEFDSLYGHRRDVAGYAAHLAAFDARLSEILAVLRPGDLAVITADHGNDPTWRGTDHTRERVPVLMIGAGAGSLGQIGFADVAETIADHLGIAPGPHGRSVL